MRKNKLFPVAPLILAIFLIFPEKTPSQYFYNHMRFQDWGEMYCAGCQDWGYTLYDDCQPYNCHWCSPVGMEYRYCYANNGCLNLQGVQTTTGGGPF